ncbi:hypothetical protein [Mesorhizobium sp.]|uniref:hypothetical protein n=1 Tax=Mesorhizobium sp. TaxID=1871066 RepID=UPI0025C4801C|nr:hypothetical protein [Mesorhizobium sp.]
MEASIIERELRIDQVGASSAYGTHHQCGLKISWITVNFPSIKCAPMPFEMLL